MALNHAVRILYDHVTVHLSSLCKRKYLMAYYTLAPELCDAAQRGQARKQKPDSSYPTAVVYQYPALSQGCLCYLISCRYHILREAAAGLA